MQQRMLKILIFFGFVMLLIFTNDLTTRAQQPEIIRLPFAPRYTYNEVTNTFAPNGYPITDACANGAGGNPPGSHTQHTGIAAYAVDIGMPNGTPIYAPVSGTVTTTYGSGTESGYGLLLKITEDNNVDRQHWLAHLSKFYVTGGHVNRGDLIAYSGDTGYSSQHLHYHVTNSSGTAAVDVRSELPDINWVDQTDYCSGGVGSDGTAYPSQIPNGFTANNCAEFYNIGILGVTGFDAPNCQGNIIFNFASEGDYDLQSIGVNDRLRSVSTHNFNFWLYGNGGGDMSLSHCHSNDMWDLDTDPYNSNSIRIGWQDNFDLIDIRPGTSEEFVSSGNNMTSRITVTSQACPLDQDTRVSFAQISRGETGDPVPSWLYNFSVQDNPPSIVEVYTEVEAIAGIYDAHRILVNGSQVCETTAPSQTCAINTSGLSVGGYTIDVQYRRLSDNGNWATALNYSRSSYFTDITPPTTTATITGTAGNNGWYRSGVTVNLTATDNLGVSETLYQIDGGPVTQGTSISLPNDGIYTVNYWSVDTSGNLEEVNSLMVFIDQTPPTTSGTVTGPRDINGIYRDNVVADILSTDNLSGVAFTNCSFDNRSTWQNLVGTQIAVNGNGVHQFFCQAEDVAGNVGVELDSGPIIINMYVVFNRSAVSGFYMTDNTNSAITGDVYSEGQVLIERNTGVHVYGSVEVVNGSLILDTSNVNTTVANTVLSAPHVDGINYPFSYYWDRCDQYHPSGLVLNSVGNNISGVICVNGDLLVTTTNVAGNVVFVVTGNIDFNPTQGGFTTSDPANGMIIYSLGNTLLRGNGYDFNGLVYAGGNITNSSTDTVNFGSYVANNVTFNSASGITLFYDAAFSSSTHNLPLSGGSFYDASGGGNPAPTPMPTNTPTNTPAVTNTPTATTIPVPNCSLTNEWTDDDQAMVTMVWTDGFDDWHYGLWGDGDDFTTQHDASGVQTQSNRYPVDAQGAQLVYDLSLTINGPGGTNTCYLQIDFATNPMWVSAYGPVETNTPVNTPTSTATATVTNTATASPTASDTATPTFTPEASDTATATATNTATVTPTNTATATSTATATQSTPAPTCTLNVTWDGDDRVDATMSWTGGFDENHDVYWGDGDDSSISSSPSDTDTEGHLYSDVDQPGANLIFTISYTINGPGGSITCSQTIDFATNPDWIAEYGS